METGKSGEDPKYWDERYNINIIPSELFLKFRKEIEGFRVGLNMEERNIQILWWQIKVFTSLADAVSCSSIKEIVKPEDAYTMKHKNLLAHGALWDKNRHYPPKSNLGGMSKRPARSRSTMALAASLSSYESKNNSENSNLISSTPILCRPPLHPHGRRSHYNESSSASPQQNFSPWRSFSLCDLQCAAATTPCITGLEFISGDKDEVQ